MTEAREIAILREDRDFWHRVADRRQRALTAAFREDREDKVADPPCDHSWVLTGESSFGPVWTCSECDEKTASKLKARGHD